MKSLNCWCCEERKCRRAIKKGYNMIRFLTYPRSSTKLLIRVVLKVIDDITIIWRRDDARSSVVKARTSSICGTRLPQFVNKLYNHSQHSTSAKSTYTFLRGCAAPYSRHGFSAVHALVYNAQKTRQRLVTLVSANQEAQAFTAAQRLLSRD